MNNITFDIKCWNINQKITQLHQFIITGTEKNNVNIACLQEFHINNFKLSNLKYEEHDPHQCYVFYNGAITGVFTYSVGIAQQGIGMPKFPKRQDYGTLVVWNSNVFDFCGIKTPSYFINQSFKNDELGIRTTPWVILCTRNFKFFNIMSVHGHATNQNKKNALFKSIFNDMQQCNIPTLIIGDFNYNPKDLIPLIPTHLNFKPFNGITHIDPTTKHQWCIDHVVYKLITITNLLISGIDQQNGCMKSLLAEKGHDHGILSFSVTF